jgi:hypothetical protein
MIDHQKYLQHFNSNDYYWEKNWEELYNKSELPIDEFQEFIDTLEFIPLYTTKYLYRALSWEELTDLVSGKEIINKYGRNAFSFAKDKSTALYVGDGIQKEEAFYVTFDSQVLRNNFLIKDVIPKFNYLVNNMDVFEHISELTTNDNVKNEIFGFFSEMLDFVDENGEYEDLTNYESFLKLIELKDHYFVNHMIQLASKHECILFGNYWLIHNSGMIKNIQTLKEENLDKIYYFIQENQDKLNLYL